MRASMDGDGPTHRARRRAATARLRFWRLEGVVLALCLSACGLTDSHSIFPEPLRQPLAKPSQAEPEPDVKELVRVHGRELFRTEPTDLTVSGARRDREGHGFTVCVKAVTANAGGELGRVTLVVTIERGTFTNRRRATPEDGCESATYDKI
jgi:hypothetical protein